MSKVKAISCKSIVEAQLLVLRTGEKYLEEVTEGFSETEVNTRLDLIKPTFDRFVNALSSDPALDGDVDFDDFQTRYFQVVTKLSELRDNIHKKNGRSSVETMSHVTLPKLTLPSFSGTSSYEWVNFKDNFQYTIINDKSLSQTHKLIYLKSCLKGEALNSISHLNNSDSNFEIAWDLLFKTYNNPRLISEQLVKSLINLNPVKQSVAQSLRAFTNEVFKLIRMLKSIHPDMTSTDILAVPLIVNKLDIETQSHWEDQLSVDKYPTLAELEEFLLHRINVLSVQAQSSKSVSNSQKQYNQSGTGRIHIANEVNTQGNHMQCRLCKQNHQLYQCKDFASLSPSDRRSKVRALHLCYNCLKPGHSVSVCRNQYSCKVCHQRHNSLLHLATTQEVSKQSSVVGVSLGKSKYNTVLLATAMVKLVGPNGNSIKVRALLDTGATHNILSSKACNTLQLPRESINVTVKGISAKSSVIKYGVTTQMNSLASGSKYQLSCLVMDKLTDSVPSMTIDPNLIKIPQGLRLADPKYFQSGPIDLILNSTTVFNILNSKRKTISKELYLTSTTLGWILAGSLITDDEVLTTCYANLSILDNQVNHTDSLSKQLSQFWGLEQPNLVIPKSNQDRETESFYTSTTTVGPQGQYTVQLPFVKPPSLLGSSYELVKRQFFYLEKRLSSNVGIKKQYCQFMQEYLDCNHMQLVSDEELQVILQQPHYFIPHHHVVKESSITTKLRVVFNASSKTTSGVSLNDLLSKGPQLLKPVSNVLLKFRSHRFGVIADVEKMYRQIRVKKEDTVYQLIFWRDDPSLPLKVYRLLTVTYGLTSAPYLAQRTLRQLASDNESSHPLAAQIVLNDFYVDDLISGAEDVESLERIHKELVSLLSLGDMNLRKWYSNSEQFLKDLMVEDSQAVFVLPVEEGDSIPTLGMQWNPSHDQFQFHVHFGTFSQYTRRIVVSEISKIFDPLRLLGPLSVKCRLLVRAIVKQTNNWDQVLNPDLCSAWFDLKSHLEKMSSFSIPRSFIISSMRSVELHGFSDASLDAYGGVFYVRAVDSVGSVKVTLLASKSKIAPLKPLTVPRLELCGVLEMSKLYNEIKASLSHLTFSSVNFWVDSTIALHWVHSEPCKFQIFIGNRIQQIQEVTSDVRWFHIPTHFNPADELSRGSYSPSSTWWSGPAFLSNETISSEPFIPTMKQGLPEERKALAHVHLVTGSGSVFETLGLNSCSSWKKLVHIFCYIYRLVSRCKRQTCSESIPIGKDEFDNAQQKIVSLVQRDNYSDELKLLKQGKPVNKSSRILSLAPYVDDQGIIRVGGRLGQAALDNNSKHPILLPANHVVTRLIISHFHKTHLHCGPQLLLSLVRQMYWPVNGLTLCKSIVRHCVCCVKCDPKPFNYIMGQLPSERVNVQPPFFQTGMDFAGPFSIKSSTLRKASTSKMYICIFVCMATKACHFEIVADLSTKSFIASLRRFISRRGVPSVLYCDNATNFVGANNHLKAFPVMVQGLSGSSDLLESFENRLPQFRFIPSRTPSFGGLWEAAVRSCKRLLVRNMKFVVLNYEQFLTLLNQVEAFMNSRPLTALTSNLESLEVLTPGHFLIGRPLLSLPEPVIDQDLCHIVTHWRKVQHIYQSLWRRWSLEYLNTLQCRSKWCHSTGKQPLVNDVVIMKEKGLPPTTWRMARIIELHPGKDGVVRAVTVKTSTGTSVRGVRTLCPLPISSEVHDSSSAQ